MDQVVTQKSSSLNSSDSDWRPRTYVVRKGDTLIKMGLEFGYDYKEIAQWNNLSPPYTIYVGQVLQLRENAPSKPASATTNTTNQKSAVIITPLKQEDSQSTPNTPPVINEPKATRSAYIPNTSVVTPPVLASDTDKKNTPPLNVNPSSPTTLSSNPASVNNATKPVANNNSNMINNEKLEWVWPTQGKVITTFNESNNKGIDIAGSLGQAVQAAATGKVIYSGSDLRGYGKLLIIKHNSSLISVYAHNNNLLIKEGQMVTGGQKIAEMGNSDSKIVKLHFEIRRQGKSVDPMQFLP